MGVLVRSFGVWSRAHATLAHPPSHHPCTCWFSPWEHFVLLLPHLLDGNLGGLLDSSGHPTVCDLQGTSVPPIVATHRCVVFFSVSHPPESSDHARLTMTMTMTHSEKSNQQSLVAWPYRRERRGHDPACAVGKVCTYTLLMTVCSTSDRLVNSSRWNPRILYNATKGAGEIQEGNRTAGGSVAGTVAHQSVLNAFYFSLILEWWCVFSLQYWSGPVMPSRDAYTH